jgi:hypothetical protein
MSVDSPTQFKQLAIAQLAFKAEYFTMVSSHIRGDVSTLFTRPVVPREHSDSDAEAVSIVITQNGNVPTPFGPHEELMSRDLHDLLPACSAGLPHSSPEDGNTSKLASVMFLQQYSDT